MDHKVVTVIFVQGTSTCPLPTLSRILKAGQSIFSHFSAELRAAKAGEAKQFSSLCSCECFLIMEASVDGEERGHTSVLGQMI